MLLARCVSFADAELDAGQAARLADLVIPCRAKACTRTRRVPAPRRDVPVHVDQPGMTNCPVRSISRPPCFNRAARLIDRRAGLPTITTS